VDDEPYAPKEFPDNTILRDENGEAIRVNYVDRDSLEPDPNGFVARASYFDKFGYFRVEREAYDRQYGETHSGKINLITRFNIWVDAPACINEGAAAPYADCTVKPIIYYTSPGFPVALREQAQITVDGWNRAFKRTVNKLKYDDARALEDVEDVVVLRDNTYAAEDGTVTNRGQRIGDLRFNMLAWVDNPNLAGLLGYGPSSADPLSGEIIQASAFMYGAGVDQLARYGTDVVDLTNDPTLFDRFVNGEDVQVAVHQRQANDANARERTQRFAQQKINSTRNKDLRALGADAFRRDQGSLRARMDALKDTPLEERLASDPLQRAYASAHGLDPNVAHSDAARPQNWAMGRAMHRERQRRKHLEQHNVTHARYFDTSVVSIADDLKDLPAEERYAELQRRIFRSTAEHEMGHNFGLRHNFEASTDALNYGREYWDLKGTGAQALELPTEDQLAAGIRQHQYASIMDYGSRFMSDIEGLGMYDEAAIAFGYGDLVEVFAGAPDDNLLELYSLEDVLRRRHYTKLPEIFGGIDGMHDRRLVHYQQVIDQLAGRAPWDLWEVPYRFCSDEYDGATATCAVFDEGADAYEIADAARREYVEYFPFLAFARDNRYFNEWDYMWRLQSRTFWPMLSQYQNHVFTSFYEEYFYDCLALGDPACDYTDGSEAEYYNLQPVTWSEADDGGLPGAAATRLLLDTLGEVIAQPEPGSYFYDDAEQMQVLYSYAEDPLCPPGSPAPDCSELNVALGEGRFTESQWDVESGYTFYDRLLMVGSFYDKLVAVETAVTSDTYFLGVDTGADASRYAIGLSLYFPEEVHKLIGGVAAEDYATFAGVMCTQDQQYLPPSVSDPAASPCEGGPSQVVDPATSFTIELYAIWYGMAFLPYGFDLDFNDRMKIWLDGSGEQITPTDPGLVFTFTNPLNNRSYHAMRSIDGVTYAPGAALLDRAQRFADAYLLDPSLENRWRLENLVTTIEDVRGTYDLYGTFYF
jgi:Met-zincin